MGDFVPLPLPGLYPWTALEIFVPRTPTRPTSLSSNPRSALAGAILNRKGSVEFTNHKSDRPTGESNFRLLDTHLISRGNGIQHRAQNPGESHHLREDSRVTVLEFFLVKLNLPSECRYDAPVTPCINFFYWK